ncbi:uncharacterized protein LOC119356608 isoform X2 [Triticum dicoccoides]|uniref:uncharacterized protein LOC119356608 isoform X2 n=1 Tax=Triticum dicoccoides TaxID=85692 RepID=UPI00188E5035|nr:uncharacterized protein LOC119356608 isoform X2 [Triticum dicoccoides]
MREESEGMEFLLDAVDRFPVREEYADNLEHPDPVPLMYLLDKVTANTAVHQADDDSAAAEMLGDGLLTEGQVGGQHRREESPTRSAQSTGKAPSRECATRPCALSI